MMQTVFISRDPTTGEEHMTCTCGQWKMEASNSVYSLVKSIDHIQQSHYEGIVKIEYVTTSDTVIVTERTLHVLDRRK